MLDSLPMCSSAFTFRWITILLWFIPTAGLWAAPSGPNIILIIADDLGPQLGSYGDPNAKTPNIDRLAAEGTRFDRGYVTTASCSPSRGSIFTGLYPHQHGMMGLSHFGTERMHDHVPILPNELKKLGYRTAIVGKTHMQPEELFDWNMRVTDSRHVIAERDVLWMNGQAMKFVDETPSDAAFFLVMSYVDPHRGNSDQGSSYGAGRNKKFPRKKRGLPENPTSGSEIVPFAFLGLDSPEIREELADYYGAVERLDIGVGDLRKRLERRALWRGSLVLFVGDHGPDVTRGKMSIYESATRVPFLLRVPGGRPGVVRDELVSTVDILPTLLDVAGDDELEQHQGRSLLPLTIPGAAPRWRHHLFTEYITHVPWQFYPRYAIRDEHFKLILNLKGGDWENPLNPTNYCNAWWESRKEHYEMMPIRQVYDRVEFPPKLELFDLENDPYEWNNLASKPEYSAKVDELLLAIREWRTATKDPLLEASEFSRQITKGMDAKIEWQQRRQSGKKP